MGKKVVAKKSTCAARAKHALRGVSELDTAKVVSNRMGARKYGCPMGVYRFESANPFKK
jgi:hypothetical protein